MIVFFAFPTCFQYTYIHSMLKRSPYVSGRLSGNNRFPFTIYFIFISFWQSASGKEIPHWPCRCQQHRWVDPASDSDSVIPPRSWDCNLTFCVGFLGPPPHACSPVEASVRERDTGSWEHIKSLSTHYYSIRYGVARFLCCGWLGRAWALT